MSHRPVVGLALVLVLLSLFFPWFLLDAPFIRVKATLFDANEIYETVKKYAAPFISPTEILGAPLAMFVIYGLGFILFIGFIGVFARPAASIAGFLGLLIAALVYKEPAALLVGYDLAPFIEKYVSLDLGFYLYIVGVFLLLVAGFIGGKKAKEK